MGEHAPIPPNQPESDSAPRRSAIFWHGLTNRLADDRWCKSVIWWTLAVMFFLMLAAAFNSTRRTGRAEMVAKNQAPLYLPLNRENRLVATTQPIEIQEPIFVFVATEIKSDLDGEAAQSVHAPDNSDVPNLLLSFDATPQSFGQLSRRQQPQLTIKRIDLFAEPFGPIVADANARFVEKSISSDEVLVIPPLVGSGFNAGSEPFEWFTRAESPGARAFVLNVPPELSPPSSEVGTDQGQSTTTDPIVGASNTPEPGSFLLVSVGAAALLLRPRRKNTGW